MLAQASETLELDGDKARQMDRSYDVAGRFVVRHCDLLIAIWDGEQGNGRGGTADIVQYATTTDVPVWWIHASDDVPPAWISDVEIQSTASLPARNHLSKWLREEALPPSPVPRHRHNWIATISCLGQPECRSTK